MKQVEEEAKAQEKKQTPLEYHADKTGLASSMLQPTPNTKRKWKKGAAQVSTVRFDVVDADGKLLDACHGSSSALDGLEDKDELVRTFQRCRADQFGLAPPSSLIRWDVTLSECQTMLQDKLPALESNPKHPICVLKEPISSRGDGIYFVKSVEEIYTIVERHRKQAQQEGSDFLDTVMAQKGRIPAWVLQAEVYPPRLVNECKFHIRTYLVACECLEDDHLVNVYVHKRHEVRIAATKVNNVESTERNPKAHITSGWQFGGNTTQRVLIESVPSLAPHQAALEYFVASTCDHLLPDIQRRVGYTAHEQPPEIQKHAVAGLDIMMTADGRFYLLEVNVNPAAPPKEVTPPEFKKHLVGFMKDLKNLVLGYGAPNFSNIDDILARGPPPVVNGGGR